MNCDLDTSVPDWMIEHPETTAVFAELELDVACGGKSLRYVCQHRGLSPPAVLSKLLDAVNRAAAPWTDDAPDN